MVKKLLKKLTRRFELAEKIDQRPSVPMSLRHLNIENLFRAGMRNHLETNALVKPTVIDGGVQDLEVAHNHRIL